MNVAAGKNFIAKRRALLLAQASVGKRLVQLARREGRHAFRESLDNRSAVAGFNRVHDPVQGAARLVLRNLPMLALVIEPPGLRLGEIVGLRKRLAGQRIDPAGDDVQVLVRRVVMRDKNRLRRLHAKLFKEALRRRNHLLAGRILSRLPRQRSVQAILFALPPLAGLILLFAVPFHHPPRKIEVGGALNLKADILRAKNFSAAFFTWHKLDPLAVLVLPLPHDIGQRAGDAAPFHDVRNHAVTFSSVALIKVATSRNCRSCGNARVSFAIFAS